MRSTRFLAAVAILGCESASAQFGASGGPSEEVTLLVKLPWVLVAVVLALACFGPKSLRPVLRRISRHAFAAYLGLALVLFVCILAFRMALGPMTEPLLMVGGLFMASIVFSGLLVAIFMAASVVLLIAQAALVRRRRLAPAIEVVDSAPPNPSIERTSPGNRSPPLKSNVEAVEKPLPRSDA